MANQTWVERDTLAGTDFPNEDDQARMNRYSENRLIRHAHHEDVFPRIQKLIEEGAAKANAQKWAGLNYVPANVCGLLTKTTADDMFLDPPTLDFGTEDAGQAVAVRWQEIATRSRWQPLLLDEVDGCGVNGDVAFKVYREMSTGPVIVDAVDVSLVFRGEDYFDEYATANRDSRKCLFPFIATPVLVESEWFVLFEIHEPGRVLFRAFHWFPKPAQGEAVSFASEGELGTQVEPDVLGYDVQDYDTGINAPTLIIARNESGERPFWGSSDYTCDVKAIQDSINYQLSILIDHGEKLIQGGITVLPEEMRSDVNTVSGPRGSAVLDGWSRSGTASGSVPTISDRMLGFVFENGMSKDVTRYVERTSQFEGAFKLLEGLWSLFERITGMTLDPLFEQATAPESGRAMRLSRYRDQRRVARKQVRWTETVQRVTTLALALEGIATLPPAVEWSDVVKLDDKDTAEIMQLRTGAKATLSVETSLKRYDGMTDAQAEAESKRIDEDGKMARVSSPALFSEAQTFPDETDTPPGAAAAPEGTEEEGD